MQSLHNPSPFRINSSVLSCLVARSQLNIKIDPELLKRAKAHAAKEGMTLTEFVKTVIEEAVAGTGGISLEERLARIEKQLGIEHQPLDGLDA